MIKAMLRRRYLRLAMLLLSLLFPRLTHAETGGIDLHVHLFMKQGMGALFCGDFDDAKPCADGWEDRLQNKATHTLLNQSGLSLVVVSLFAHPLTVSDPRQAIRNQIDRAERLVRDDPTWVIARSAAEAAASIDAGKRVLVLSLEGASGVLESKRDLDEFITKRGIAIVTPMHLADDHFGGAALMAGQQGLANPLALARRLGAGRRATSGTRHGIETNDRGLTRRGRALVAELIRRGVWIDLTHASEQALKTLVPMVERAGQPLLFTHTTPRSLRASERRISASMLRRVRKSRGIVALIPTADAFEAGTHPEDSCQISAFADAVRRVERQIGPAATLIGSDFNGGMRHLAGPCPNLPGFEAATGFWNIGQSAQLGVVLDSLLQVANRPRPTNRQRLDHFLNTWESLLVNADRDLDREGHSRELAEPRFEGQEGAGPSVALSLGLGLGLIGRSPTFLGGGSFAIRKTVGRPLSATPYFTFLNVDGALAVVPAFDDVPWLNVNTAIFRAQADDGLARVALDVGQVSLRRFVDIDLPWFLRSSWIQGSATFPLLLTGPVVPMVELSLGALGHAATWNTARTAHGLHLTHGRFGLGLKSYPASGWYWSAGGYVSTGVQYYLAPASTWHANASAEARVRLGVGGLFAQLSVALQGRLDTGRPESWLTQSLGRGLVGYGF